MEIIKCNEPLVHFIFLYYKGVKPYYCSVRLTWEQVERLKALKERELIDYGCELCEFNLGDCVRHLDWMVSTLCW